MLQLLACVGLTCGPGTHEVDNVCVSDALPDPRPGDSSPDSNDSRPEDTDDDSVVGDSRGDTADSPAPVVRDVWILAGQSNMDGYSYVSGLPPSWRIADPRVPLYWSGWGEFRSLEPTSFGGSYLTGPEVSFGHTLADAGHTVALVKHAVGGTDLAYYWNPGLSNTDPSVGAGWATLVTSMDAAERQLNSSGEDWRWAGFVWMQGESDAMDLGMADAYASNLAHLIVRVREQTSAAALPVVIGLISTESYWVYASTVRDAQRAVADADSAVVYVETDDLPRNVLDLPHYDGVSNRVLGERFATAAVSGADIAAAPSPQAAMVVNTWAADFDGDYTVGWTFTLDRAMSVTDIGAFAPASYLYSSTELGIWDADGELVVRDSVPGYLESFTSWRGGFWYTAVEPTVLEPGDYRLGYVSWGGDYDRYGNAGAGSMAEGVTFGWGVYAPGNRLAYPGVDFFGVGYNFIGPNLLFIEAD